MKKNRRARISLLFLREQWAGLMTKMNMLPHFLITKAGHVHNLKITLHNVRKRKYRYVNVNNRNGRWKFTRNKKFVFSQNGMLTCQHCHKLYLLTGRSAKISSTPSSFQLLQTLTTLTQKITKPLHSIGNQPLAVSSSANFCSPNGEDWDGGVGESVCCPSIWIATKSLAVNPLLS